MSLQHIFLKYLYLQVLHSYWVCKLCDLSYSVCSQLILDFFTLCSLKTVIILQDNAHFHNWLLAVLTEICIGKSPGQKICSMLVG